jgi:hypothetical protein
MASRVTWGRDSWMVRPVFGFGFGLVVWRRGFTGDAWGGGVIREVSAVGGCGDPVLIRVCGTS